MFKFSQLEKKRWRIYLSNLVRHEWLDPRCPTTTNIESTPYNLGLFSLTFWIKKLEEKTKEIDQAHSVTVAVLKRPAMANPNITVLGASNDYTS